MEREIFDSEKPSEEPLDDKKLREEYREKELLEQCRKQFDELKEKALDKCREYLEEFNDNKEAQDFFNRITDEIYSPVVTPSKEALGDSYARDIEIYSRRISYFVGSPGNLGILEYIDRKAGEFREKEVK